MNKINAKYCYDKLYTNKKKKGSKKIMFDD